jgi:hypothetical protein
MKSFLVLQEKNQFLPSEELTAALPGVPGQGEKNK